MRRDQNPASANSSKRRKVGGETLVVNPPTAVTMTLMDVKSRFRNARKAVTTSQNDLKAMFDKHIDLFDDDEIMKILQKLAGDMNACFDGAKEGMTNIDRAVTWLRTSGKGIKTDDNIE